MAGVGTASDKPDKRKNKGRGKQATQQFGAGRGTGGTHKVPGPGRSTTKRPEPAGVLEKIDRPFRHVEAKINTMAMRGGLGPLIKRGANLAGGPKRAAAADVVPTRRPEPSKQGSPPPSGSGRKEPPKASAPAPRPVPRPSRDGGAATKPEKGAIGRASNRDLPSVVLSKYKGSGNDHRYGPPVPLREGVTKSEAKGPPKDLKPAEKKGFFASLFNSRDDPSTKGEYDRRRGGARK